MKEWVKEIKIKHLFTKEEDYESIKASTTSIFEVLKNHTEFNDPKYAGIDDWICEIEEASDDVCLEVANEIIDTIYGIADANNIWIG